MKSGHSGTLVLKSTPVEAMISHAKSEFPIEAVGVLGGSRGLVSVAIPLVNVAQDTGRFFADPYSQYIATRRLEASGLELLAIYHSHPRGGTVPSEADLVFAKAWSCVHLILALDHPLDAHARMNGYRFQRDSSVEEVEIRMEGCRGMSCGTRPVSTDGGERSGARGD